MKRPLAMIALVLVVGTAGTRPASWAAPGTGRAGDVRVVTWRGGNRVAELMVRGKTIARLVGSGAGSRLRAAADVLEPLLPPPTVVSTRWSRRAAQLVVDGRAVLTVSRRDAAAVGARPADLVAQWARALDDALTIRPLTVSPQHVVLSPGHTERVTFSSLGTAPVTLGGFDEQVVGVRMSPGGAEFTGRRLGSTLVPVRLGPYAAHVAVSVRPPAGQVPRDLAVIVTGLPATPDLIREAVGRNLQGAVRLSPGAVMGTGRVAVDAPLDPGGTLAVPVDVRVRSPYGGPVDAIVRVDVTNHAIPLADPDVLLVSNRPETITSNGLLFQESLQPGRPARLLYHHMNGTPGQPRVLKITLANPGGARARVHYLSGHAGPSGDPIFIGFASTQRFLDALLAGRGYIVDVPPGGATTFTAYTLPPLALVSGLMQLQVVEGGPIDLSVHVRLPYLLDHTVTADLGTWAFPHPRGTFPGSLVELTREQPAAQPASVADLGVMSGLRDVRTGEALIGDYGVLYRLRLRLTNPADREVTTALVANAAGGLARGLFIVNGAAVDIGLMKPTEDREVMSVGVPAGGVRDLTVVTMPVAGSFYPVRLFLRPR